jgi:hypothetical protein
VGELRAEKGRSDHMQNGRLFAQRPTISRADRKDVMKDNKEGPQGSGRRNDISRYARELSSAEFRIASVIYDELQSPEVVRIRIAALVTATGMSQRETHGALKSLAENAVLQVVWIRGHTAECRRSVGTPAAHLLPEQNLGSAAALQLDRLPQQIFRPCTNEEVRELVKLAGSQEKLIAYLHWFVKMGHTYEPDCWNLFRSAVQHECNAPNAECNCQTTSEEDTRPMGAGDPEASMVIATEKWSPTYYW